MTARGVLHRLARMSTALWLLLALACSSVVGAFVPQERTHQVTLERWRQGVEGPGAGVTAVLDGLGITDVFGSPWFLTLAGLLLASLTVCLARRWAAFARAARRPPPPGRRLAALTHLAALETDLPEDPALDAVRARLARRRWRTAVYDLGGGTRQVAAQRVGWREAGSLAFHTALPAALAAAALGGLGGFTGQVDVVEGEAFADTAVAYDSVRPGRWWSLDAHGGFVLRLESFTTSEHPNGVPAEFRATATVTGATGEARLVQVEPNAPLRQDGMRVHLARHGLAPQVVVRDGDGAEVFEGHLRLEETERGLWVGTAAVGFAGHGHVLDVVLLEGAVVDGSGRLRAAGGGDVPVLLADVYPAGAARPDGLDRSAGALGATAVAAPGQPVALDGTGWTLELDRIERWVGFQVSRTPGSWLLLGAALAGLAGLTVSLFAYPRRVWVEARARPGGGTRLLVAGAARARPWVFTERFPALVADLSRSAGAVPSKQPPTRPTPSGQEPAAAIARGTRAR